MRILITGATGFIGHALAKDIIFQSADRTKPPPDVVYALVRDGVPPFGCHIINGDIQDFNTCRRMVSEVRPDVVYHLAAQAFVQVAKVDPLSTFETNVRGTYNLMEAIRLCAPNAAVVVASSDKAYGEIPERSFTYTESDPLNGRGAYDCSKSCTDLIAQSYAHSYGLRVGIIRAGNVYGPTDRDMSRIVPSIVDDIANGRPPVIRSDGSPVRDYIYISDVVGAYIAVQRFLDKSPDADSTRLWKAHAFNIAASDNDSCLSVLSLVQMAQEIAKEQWGAATLEPIILGERKGEISRQILDTEAASYYLRWQPQTGLREGLTKCLLAARQRVKW